MLNYNRNDNLLISISGIPLHLEMNWSQLKLQIIIKISFRMLDFPAPALLYPHYADIMELRYQSQFNFQTYTEIE